MLKDTYDVLHTLPYLQKLVGSQMSEVIYIFTEKSSHISRVISRLRRVVASEVVEHEWFARPPLLEILLYAIYKYKIPPDFGSKTFIVC